MNKNNIDLKFRIKVLLVFFIVSLFLSGITAFPLETELNWLSQNCFDENSEMCQWITQCYEAVFYVNTNYPMLSYGTDWLAFAHVILSILFIGPLINPVKNIWVIEFGMIACVLVLPLALIAGPVREVPFFWRMIDCSFGVIGIIPLSICRKYILQLEKIQQS